MYNDKKTKERRAYIMAEKGTKRKSYCIVDDVQQTVTFAAEKLTKKEQETVKGLIGIGYKVIRKKPEEMYLKKEIYTRENVEKFLEAQGEKAEAKFKAIEEEIAIDKDTGAIKTYKSGEPRKKGYVGALKWFKDTYKKEDFIKFLEEEKAKEDKKKKEEKAKEDK